MARHGGIIEGGHHGTETDKCKYSLCHSADIAFHLLFMLVACRYNLIYVCLVGFFLQMLTRLETILTAGLEPHLSLKILQFNAILLGPQVVEPLAAVLRDTLMNLTSCIHSKQKGGGYGDAMDGGFGISQGEDRGTTTLKYALAALSFAEGLMQLFPDLGLSICAPTISKIILSLPRAVCQNENIAAPLLGVFFECFGRMLWMNPNCLDEIFASNPDVETEVAVVLEQYISSVKSVPMIAMLNAKVQKVLFVKQKGAAVSRSGRECKSF